MPQRSAVVVLTDGIDTRSRLTSEQVSTIASGIDIPVYIVAVMSTIDDPRETEAPAQRGDGVGLPTLARWTGGEMFIGERAGARERGGASDVDELRHQYVLAFEASSRAGWRPLEVRARESER